ncbi:MAG: NADH-quinone oxidoreductase subunit J [Campylobacterota bacterium]|nr:NADH-quinone oxidoreductase subunit J [Campylobacterota bacterium]
MSNIPFIFLASFSLIGGIVAIASTKPMNSALGLLLTALCLSGLYLTLDAKFLFMAQIIVYVGAVITLILIILMFLNIDESHLPDEKNKYLKISMGIFMMLPFNFIILQELSLLPAIVSSVTEGTTKAIGQIMFSSWVVAFELISVLLLVALVGAIILAKKFKKETVKDGSNG